MDPRGFIECSLKERAKHGSRTADIYLASEGSIVKESE